MQEATEAPQGESSPSSTAPAPTADLDQAIADVAHRLDGVAGPSSASEEDSNAEGDPEDSHQAPDDAAPKKKEDKTNEKALKPRPEPKPSAWSQLHKREKELQNERSLVAKEKSELAEIQRLIAEGKKNPLAAIRAMGYEDGQSFLEMIAETGGKVTPEQEKLWEVEKRLEAEVAARKEREELIEQEKEQQNIQEQVDSWHGRIADYIKSEIPDSIVNVKGVEQTVFRIIQERYQQSGGQEVMDIPEAVKYVESQMDARIDEMLEELVGNKRGLTKFQELATKLSSKSGTTSKRVPNSLNSSVRNSTRPLSHREKEADFDTALAQKSKWLSEQFGGR